MGSSDKIIAQLGQDTRVLVKYSLIKKHRLYEEQFWQWPKTIICHLWISR